METTITLAELMPALGLGFFIVIILGTVFALSRSPSTFTLDKTRDRCTKETKYIWQRFTQGEVLCRLSEVKAAELVNEKLGPCNLCLKLKSGKKVVIFSTAQGKHGYPAFMERILNQINNFLNGNDDRVIIRYSHFEVSKFILYALFGTLIFAVLIIFCVNILAK